MGEEIGEVLGFPKGEVEDERRLEAEGAEERGAVGEEEGGEGQEDEEE